MAARLWLVGGCFILCSVFFSCSSKTLVVAPVGGTAPAKDIEYYDSRLTAIETARKEIGDGYRYAGSGPNKWDCSGLVNHAYAAAAIEIERSSRNISKMTSDIPLNKSQPGDLIFFKKDGRVFHVSMITERNQKELWVIHSTTSRGVIEENIAQSSYWQSKIYKVISLAALAKL